MKKALKILYILAFGLLISGANFVPNVPKSIKLEYVPKKGSSTKYLMVMTAVTKMEGLGGESVSMPLESITKINSIFTQNINDVDSEGNVDMSVIYNDVSLEIEQGGEKTSIPLGNRLGGKALHLKLSKEGKVLDIKGLEDLPGNFKDFDLQKLYPQVNPYFPDKEIKIGDTWTQDIKENTTLTEGVTFEQETRIDYELKEFKEIKGYKCVVIEIKLKTKIKGGAKKTEAGLWIETSGTGTGIMNYAYKASKSIDSKLTMNLSSRMRLGTPEDQTTKTNQQIEITMEMIR